MIRTHNPRGFAWNCPSLFQQTPTFRDIHIEDCEVDADANADEVLDSDLEDEFPLSERVAKRRRIARLTDNFLNGTKLHISSASLVPDAVRNAVARSFPLKKAVWKAFDGIQSTDHSTGLWEDVLDDREILHAFLASNQPVLNGNFAGLDNTAEPMEEELIITDAQARASCGPKRRVRSAKVTFGPSDDALRQAAAIRNRTFRSYAQDLPRDSQPRSLPRPIIPETQTQPSYTEVQETASDCGPSPTPACTSSKWIQSGALEIQNAVDEDCSRDELGSSSVFTPQRIRTRARPLARAHATSNTSFSTATDSTAAASNVVSLDTHVLEAAGDNGDDARAANNIIGLQIGESSEMTHPVYYTALEGINGTALAQNVGLDFLDNDSQAQLRQRQGVRGTARISWTTINEVTESSEVLPAAKDQLKKDQAPDVLIVCPHLQELVKKSGQRPSKSRKVRAADNTPTQPTSQRSNRRRTATSESQEAAEQIAGLPEDKQHQMDCFQTNYTSVATNNGKSPFIFRKRPSKFNRSDDPDVELITERAKAPQAAKTSRTRMAFRSSDSPQAVRRSLGPSAGAKHNIADPHTPLVNEHLNSILPRGTTSGRRHSSLSKALREELKVSGAELTRCSDETSSQSEPAQDNSRERNSPDRTRNEDEHIQPRPDPVVEPQLEMWPGTQVMLAQAHQDLFTSPDKTDLAHFLGDKTTPQALITSRPSRRPLRQLSQEPMPSTQALLDDWQGWSSVKKPRETRLPGTRLSSLAQSPTLGKGATPITASDPVQSSNEVERRTSSLRFSIPIAESPERPQANGIRSPPLLATASSPARADSSSFLKAAAMKGDNTAGSTYANSTMDLPRQSDTAQQLANSATDDSLSFSEPLPSYQNAQNPELPDYNSQDLADTVTELRDGVLGTARIVMESSGF